MVLFSIAAFVITLRETMEAALIVGILLAYLKKTDNERFNRDIWIGSILAIILSLVGAVIFAVAFGGLEGRTEKLFEGIVMILAASVLTWMIIWMFYNSYKLKYELEEKISLVINENKRFALMSLAFISVFREGIETVLFLSSIGGNEGFIPETVGALTGFAIAILLAVLLFRGTLELDLAKFFNVTSIILIVFAAGLFSRGIHEFQELGWFGVETSIWNRQLFDVSFILNDKDNGLGTLTRALFGYQDKPSLLELIAYAFYWVAIFIYFKKSSTSSKRIQVAVS